MQIKIEDKTYLLYISRKVEVKPETALSLRIMFMDSFNYIQSVLVDNFDIGRSVLLQLISCNLR